MRKKIISILMIICVFFSMSFSVSFADEPVTNSDKKPLEENALQVDKTDVGYHYGSEADKDAFGQYIKKYNKQDWHYDVEDYIYYKTPADYSTYYYGEKLISNYRVWDTWEDWYTEPALVLYDVDYEEPIDVIFGDDIVDVNSFTDWTFSWKLTKSELWHSGNYRIYYFAMPVDEYLYYPNDVSIWDILDSNEWDIPATSLDFKVRTLGKPSNLKLTTGKRKVTVKWSAGTGAQKYQVYRSLKSGSGYKLVKTTSNRSFVDKKVKRGKRYYYKVKSLRTKHGKITSSFCAKKRSKRVR